MPLDPIVSLAVAIAERPGSYAFLLGSGVSRDAGAPTGGEVLWRAVGELYRLKHVTEETPDDPTLQAWLVETGRAELTYSDVLELIAPDPATRRDYLAQHFEGAVPGTTHELLADMAAEGLIRVFVTTNFDRLLEQALQARGIQPVVVTADADLASAPRREHESCWVLKVHDDYLQQTIRNTPAELAQLEPEVTRELAEVFDRYGVVVLGYSGANSSSLSGRSTAIPCNTFSTCSRPSLRTSGLTLTALSPRLRNRSRTSNAATSRLVNPSPRLSPPQTRTRSVLTRYVYSRPCEPTSTTPPYETSSSTGPTTSKRC